MHYKKNILFLLSIFFSVTVFSNESEVGYGRFLSNNDDSIKFVKQQLLHSVTIDLINKKLIKLNLNKELFWEKFNSKKDEIKNTKIEELKERFEKRPNVLVEKERLASLKIDRSFGQLNKLLIKYSILKRSRSLTNKSLYLIKIRGVIDEKKLSRLYNQYMYEHEGNSKLSVYLFLDIKNKDFLWNELNTESKIVYNTLINNYKNYLKDTFPDLELDIKEITDIQYIKTQPSSGIFIVLKYDILKTADNVEQNETLFNIQMSSLIVDIKLNKRLSSKRQNINDYKFYYATDQSSKKSLSNFVSTLYQFPLTIISQSKDLYLKSIPKNVFTLNITHFENLSDVYKLREVLLKKLITKQVELSLETISKNNVRLTLKTIGTRAKTLSVIQTTKFNANYPRLVIEVLENVVTIKINNIQGESL